MKEKEQEPMPESPPEEVADNLQSEVEKLRDQLLRTVAELDNTRKRSRDENEKTLKYAVSGFAQDLLNVMDNFYLALDSIEKSPDDVKNFLEGVKLTHNEMKRVFDKNGLTRIYPMGEQFNPDFHEAIGQVESEQEPGTVVQVLQAGYSLKDRLLRPALVMVAKG